MNTSINMKRIKELVFWTTNESWEEFIIKCWNTNYEIFLGQHCIKVVGCHHVRRHGKPYHEILKKKYKNPNISYFGYGQPYIWAGFSPGSSICWGQGPKPVTTESKSLDNMMMDEVVSPSGLHPVSISVSGHSQLPVSGL